MSIIFPDGLRKYHLRNREDRLKFFSPTPIHSKVFPMINPAPSSLGQLGYEAYANHTGWVSLATRQPLPAWNQLPPSIQQAWEATGQACQHYFMSQPATPPSYTGL